MGILGETRSPLPCPNDLIAGSPAMLSRLILDHFVRKRGLTPTGSPILNCTSQLLSVLSDGQPAML